MLKKYTLVLVSIFFIACGGGGGGGGSSSSSTTQSNVNISGKAIDGYLKGATVFIDLNNNGILDDGEPQTTTADDGSYSFDIDPNKLTSKPSIIVFGGIDDSTGEEFTGELSSMIEKAENTEVNITPITTLVDGMLGSNVSDTAIDEAKQKVANSFNLNKDDLNKDPIATFSENPEIYKQSLIIVKAIEVLNAKGNKAQNKENFRVALKALSEVVEDDTKIEDTNTVTISGKAINLEKELDLIDGEVDKINTVPTNGEGYGDILDKTKNKEQIESLAQKTNQEKLDLARQLITEYSIRGINSSLKHVKKNLNLKINPYRTTVTWSSSNTDVLKNDGTVIRPNVGESSVDVVLTVVISKGKDEEKVTSSKTFNITVLPLEISDIDAVTLAKNTITFDLIKNANISENNITSNLTLSTKAKYDVSIDWTSTDTSVLTHSGIVSRPSIDAEDKNVTLIAIISKNGTKLTRVFSLTISKMPVLNSLAVIRAASDLDINDILKANTSSETITSKLNLYTNGLYDTKISWTSSNESLISSSGLVNRPTNEMGDSLVTLTAKISKGESSITKEFEVTVKAILDEEILNSIYKKLTFDKIKNLNSIETLIVSDLTLISQIEKATISWTSSNETILNSSTGKITRPDISKQENDENITLTATLNYKTASKNIVFDLVVKAYDSSDNNSLQKDFDVLDFNVIKKNNTDISKIGTDLYLPIQGINGSTITWNSSNKDVLSNSGVVSRPNNSVGSESLTLTATLTNSSGSLSKEFNIIVLAAFSVATNLDFTQDTKVSESFRSNGLDYTLKIYSNLIREELFISNSTKDFKLDVKVNNKLLDTLSLPIEYKNQIVKLKIYSSKDSFNSDTLKYEKEFILNQSSINLEDVNFKNSDDLKLPSFTRTDTLMPPMVSDF